MSLDTIFKLSVIVNMIDNLSGPMAGINSSVDSSVSKIQKVNQGFADMTKAGVAMAGAGAEITKAVLAPVEATFETRRALGELKAMGVKEFETLENAAKQFSDTWSGTTKAEFLKAAIDIKGGIDSLVDEGVAKYTEIAGVTAKATGSTIDEMTSLFATGYGIYKDYYSDISDIDFAEVFSAGIAEAILVFKASGSSMAQSITALGGSATTANVPLEEQLAILGQLQATMSGSEAGTKYRAFLRTVAKAGEELGLSFVDANNQLFSMPQILETLKAKYGETLDAIEKQEIQKAFGSDEAVALIDLLYSKTDVLQDSILTLYSAMGQGVEITKQMASAINETEPERYMRLQQRIQNVKEEIGNQLLPTVNMMLGKGEVVLEKISGWISRNQELAKVISLVVLTIGIVLAIMGTLIAVVGGVGLIFTRTAMMAGRFWSSLKNIPDMLTTVRIQAMYAGDALRAGFGGIKSFASTAVSGVKAVTTSILSMGKAAVVNGATAIKNFVLGMVSMAKQAVITGVQAMPGLIASVWSFTTALLANPITWIVVGIIALIAALILLWKNWDSVVVWIQGAWSGFMENVGAGWAWITGAFTNGIQSIKDIVTGSLSWFRESGSRILTTFTEGIQGAISAPIDAVKGGLSKIRKLLPFSDAKEGPLSTLTLSGRRVFETITSGMIQTQNLPAEVTERAFNGVGMAAVTDSTDETLSKAGMVGHEEIKKVNLREITKEKSESNQNTKEKENGTTIEKLVISLDISKLKDLPMLFKLLKEIEDYTNSNGSDFIPVGEG